MQHCVCCVADQVAAIEKRNNPHSLGQNPFIQLTHLGLNATEHRVRVIAFLQQQNAFNDVWVVNQLPVHTANGPAILPEPDFRTLLDYGNIFHAQRRSSLSLDHGIFNVLYSRNESDGLHIDLLRAGDDKTTSSIRVVVRKLLLDLSDAQSIRNELVRIKPDLIFLRLTSEARNVYNSGNLLELFLESPILDRLELHHIDFWILALKRVEVDLANG